MTATLREDRAFGAFRRALMPGYFWFTIVILAATLLIDLTVLFSHPDRLFWPTVPLIAVIGAVAAVFARTHEPSPWRVALLSPVVILAVGWYAFFVASFDASPGGTSSVLLTYVKIAIAVIGSMAERWTSGPLGTLVAFALAEGAVAVGAGAAGVAWDFDYPATITALGIAAAQVIVSRSRTRGRPTVSALTDASEADAMRRERESLETQSRALVHDTILNELAVLATTSPGPLPERTVAQLRRSLDLVESSELRAPQQPTGAGGLTEIIDRFRSEGLTVDVSGDAGVLQRLPESTALAVTGAIEQCLVNVVRHAGTDTAELVVTSEGPSVSIMIIDAGGGFDPGSVPPERLGISGSVRGRVEAVGGMVRVWSRPGAGTSIMLSVPFGAGASELPTEELA